LERWHNFCNNYDGNLIKKHNPAHQNLQKSGDLKQQNDCKLMGDSLIFDSLTLLLIDDWRE